MLNTQYNVCRCFLTHNIFLKKYNIHVKYINKTQFLKDYSEILSSRGCLTPEHLIPQVESECERRGGLHRESWERRLLLAKKYQPLHLHLYTLQPSFLDPKFLELVEAARETSQTREGVIKLLQNHQERIYSFPILSSQFCRELVEELGHYEQSPLPKGRPNTMNQYGIKLDELGFDDFVDDLRVNYLMPVTRLLYPDWGGGNLDSHKVFVVTYREGGDVDLSYHYDNAEVTLNVALNSDYYEGELYFGPMRQVESSHKLGYSHQLGRGLLHRGQQLHGALPISQGTRYNLIIWLRSSSVRNALCPMCDQVPTLEAVQEGTGDGFTTTNTDVCVAS